MPWLTQSESLGELWRTLIKHVLPGATLVIGGANMDSPLDRHQIPLMPLYHWKMLCTV